jgi:hypothetical protein
MKMPLKKMQQKCLIKGFTEKYIYIYVCDDLSRSFAALIPYNFLYFKVNACICFSLMSTEFIHIFWRGYKGKRYTK